MEALSDLGKPVIAILPFENLSGDPDQDYFGEGLAEDIITALPGVHEIYVIARTSSFQYKLTSVDIGRAARELGAQSLWLPDAPGWKATASRFRRNLSVPTITPPSGRTGTRRISGTFSKLRAKLAKIFWQSSETTAPTPAKSAAERAALSILVLPFANGTDDPGQAYIADGLTASITSDLTRIRDAFVVVAAAAFKYKGKPIDLQQIGKDQGVRFVLQGSVQRGRDKIRINAQLAGTQSNAQLWAETFEGSSANLFALQDQVTARIGNSIGREMVVLAARENETRIANPKAADLILRAKAAFLKPQSLKNLQRVEGWYRQPLERDPENATAMVGLALVLNVQAFNFRHKLAPDVKEKNLRGTRLRPESQGTGSGQSHNLFGSGVVCVNAQ